MTRAAVIGAGAWGTTFASVLTDAGTHTTLWGRDPQTLAEVSAHGRNTRALPDLQLATGIATTMDAAEALENADIVAVAVPAQKVRHIIADFAPLIPPTAVVVSLMKGVEADTHLRMSEVLAEVAQIPAERTAVVSGPNLAREIAARQPTATVVAATTIEAADKVAAATASGYFRPYTNTDVVGVELCGAYKNVIAVGVGVSDGLGFGNNTTATVITRGLTEITRLGMALGARPETFSGLAGMGDLIATCASPLSRNHMLGKRIGQGATLGEALASSEGTAEGVTTARSIQELAASLGVDVPICDAVVTMLAGEVAPKDVLGLLLSRPRKSEVG
ncbi:NAD(P)H-dependent glycerol-3-phosphate dehydrogenase [Demequina sp.]|uniref:NAD(P)H-dependent glycerol-3-phosphate dehydrogenase n=1 Tax=Demequina sp. TaxID=2050685 RepID=UPI003D0EF13A